MEEFPRPKLKKKKKGVGLGGSAGKEEGERRVGGECAGVLMGSWVLVQSEADVATLRRLGCYGKGVSSQSFSIHSSTAEPRTGTLESSRRRGAEAETDSQSRKRTRLDTSRLEPYGENERQGKRRRELHRERSNQRQLGLVSATETESAGSSDTPVQDCTPVGLERAAVTLTEGGRGEEGVSESAVLAWAKGNTHTEAGPLCLTAEEAVYLTTEVGILRVHLPPPNSATHFLSPQELWKRFCEDSRRFPFTYTVYRHYRRKGWVPKPGLKFGADFILYKDGPESYHSSYAVLVCEGLDGTESGGTRVCERPSRLRWMDAIAHCRVCESTGKELVLVSVCVPSGCGWGQLSSSPEVADSLCLSELLVTRWVPERDRE